MIYHTLSREQVLSITIEHAWDFFSTPLNLSKITPPDMSFEILTKFDSNTKIQNDMLIDYNVSPFGFIKVKWQTIIREVNPPHSFIDEQLKGPFKLWHHTHKFIELDNGVKVIDEVKYILPFSILGSIVHQFFVKKRLNDIFEHRRSVLERIFV